MPSRQKTWRVELTRRAERSLRRLDRAANRRVLDYLGQFEVPGTDPRAKGRALRGPLGSLWRYRVGSYRILCSLEDGALVVLVVDVVHRSDAYR
ncbi:MAG: type II toxin-antitoxin system RelE/ParE family toxin [Acidobacteria bacterium]|nr:type II toxin-antitoxin system RelE/ParE family toxin [Acidobacteriota bacterium]